MPSVKTTEELRKGMQTIWIIWGAMMGSLAIYLIVCQLLAGKGIRIDIGPIYSYPLFRNLLYIISAVELVLIHYIRKLILKTPIKQRAGPSDLKYQAVLRRYTSALVVSLALADSIGIYGVILFFMSKDFQSLYIFVMISAITMFIYRPKREEIEKLAIAMEEAKG